MHYNSHAPAWAGTPVRGSNLERLVTLLWMEVLHRPTDTIPDNIDAALGPLRELHFKGEWYDVFDILEVLLTALPSAVNRKDFEAFVNASLAQEAVGYRLVNGQVLQLTQQEELDAIDSAIQAAPSPVRTHIQTALRHLADRRHPDYRNSIKESISAVESAVKLLEKDEKATLGQVLKRMSLHKALERGLAALYGYTSDGDGIRHGLMDQPSLGAADAKFFLVVCSAFVNYATERIR